MNRKRLAYKLCAFLLAILPLAVYIFINRGYYFAGSETSFGISIFLILIVVLYAMKDKFSELFKNNAQMKISLFLLVVFWGVSKVYSEVILLSFLSFVGSLASLPFSFLAKKEMVKSRDKKQVELTREAVSSLVAISKKD